MISLHNETTKDIQQSREKGDKGSPDILGEAILDELLILVLVKAHEDGVAAGFRARLEVEDHDFPSPRAQGEKGESN